MRLQMPCKSHGLAVFGCYGRAGLLVLCLSFFSPRAFSDSPSANSSGYVWKSVAIHGGGFVCGIITDPNVPGLMYARTDVGGGYRWDSKNQTWVGITDWVRHADGNLLGCESIAIDPSDSNRIYAALGMYTNSWGGNGAIVRSSDRGATFQRTDMPIKMGGNCPGRSIGERLAVDPNDGRVLFFGSRANGLWKSTDQAVTWTRVQSFPDVATTSAMDGDTKDWPLGISFVKFDRHSGTTGSPTPVIYAGVCTRQLSFYRSTDGGSSWQPVPNQPVGFRPNHLAAAPQGPYYISYGDQAGPNGMTDGAVWEFDPQTDRWTDITPVKPSGYDRFGYGAVTVDPRRPGTLMACSIDRWNHGDTVFRTTDNGRHWTSQTVGGKNYDRSKFNAPDAPWAKDMGPHWLGDIVIDPFDSDHVMFVTGYGIWASHDATALDNGGQPIWTFEDRGLEETVPMELVSPPEGPHLISVIGDFDGFTHDNLDVSPALGRHTPHIGSTSGLDFAGSVPNRIVRAGGDGKAFYSQNGGHGWTEFPASPPNTRNGGEIAISSDGQSILWDCGSGTYRSTDLGQSWTECRGLPGALKPVSDKSNPNLFYCFDQQFGQLLVSRNGGESFSPAASGLPHRDGMLRSVPGRAGDLWLACGDRLLHSADAGNSFTEITSVDKADKFGFGKASPDAVYPAIFMSGVVQNVDGLFRSDNAGESWIRIDDDQHSYGYLDVVIGDPRVYGRVYVGTSGRGIVYGDLPSANQ